jgi:hypothetical protein
MLLDAAKDFVSYFTKSLTNLEFPMAIKRTFFLVAMAIVTFLVAPLLTTKAHHAVLRFNLEEMVATADRIFVGKCVNVKETEENIAKGIMPVTYYTFEVSSTIKGQVPQTFTFKQLGHANKKARPDKVEPTSNGYVVKLANIHGMSTYNIGDEVMLMLIPQYMDGQMTYPVGLYQGAFYISRTSAGKTVVKNSINNRGLFTNPYNNYRKSAQDARIVFPDADRPVVASRLSPQTVENLTSKPGALPLDDFAGIVRAIVDMEKR